LRHTWCKDQLLPFLDLTIFSRVMNCPFKNDGEIYSRLRLFPEEKSQHSNPAQAISAQTRPDAETMISDEMIRALTAIAYRPTPAGPSRPKKTKTLNLPTA
jgi:hypothetical protein